MPIFEDNEQITSEELKRQQLALNNKVFRLESAKFFSDLIGMDYDEYVAENLKND